jgi:predicted nucleic acid-binding protein
VICVDASVAVKWVLAEDGSEAALDLYVAQRDNGVIAPPFMPVEVSNAVWRREARGLLTEAGAEEALAQFAGFAVQLALHEDLYIEAVRLARRFARPTVYDMHYVALAQIAGCELWTADRSLLNAIAGQLSFVKPLTP